MGGGIMSIKIAISGKFGCGKSTFFEVARKQFPNLNFVEGKFASNIYHLQNIIQKELGVIREKDGKLLQFLGSHFKEEYGEDIWIKKYFDQQRVGTNEIITDCRFPIEMKTCRQKDYYLIRIDRQYQLRANNQGNRNPNHISETALDKVPDYEFDYVINNNGSFDLFEAAIIHIIQELIRGEHGKEAERTRISLC